MRIGLLVVLLGLLAVPALAETPEDRATFGDCLSRDVATALTACTRLIESKPSEPAVLARALYYRGSAYDSKGDYPSAITDFTESIRVKPQALGYGGRAFARMHDNDFKNAIADFDEAIKISPQDAAVYQWRGFSYLSMGDNIHALADFDVSLRIDPDNVEAYRAPRPSP